MNANLSFPRLCALSLALLFALLLPLACGDDDDSDDSPTGPGSDLPSGTPSIPAPGSASETLPEYSDILVDEAVAMPFPTFRPYVETIDSSLLTCLNGDRDHDYRLKEGFYTLWSEVDGFLRHPGLDFEVHRSGDEGWTTLSRSDDSLTVFYYLGTYEGHTYYAGSISGRLHQAMHNCRMYGGILANIGSAGENDEVTRMLQALEGHASAYLIALNDESEEGTFAWSEGEDSEYRNWYPGEPNNAGDGEDLVELIVDGGTWNDINYAQHILLEVDSEQPEADLVARRLYIHNDSHIVFGENLTASEPFRMAKVFCWRKVFQTSVQYPSTYEQQHSYTRGVSDQRGMELGYSIGLSTTASGTFFGSGVEVTLSAEFRQNFTHTRTITEEETIRQTYTVNSVEGKTVHFSLWQFIERYTFVDGNGVFWRDPIYTLSDERNTLDIKTDQEYQQSVLF